MTNPFHQYPGLGKGRTSVESLEVHKRDDADSGPEAHHHTLGFKAGQAAPGNLLMRLLEQGAFGRVGDFQFNDTLEETDLWKRANGQLLLIADYPEAFELYGVKHGGNGTTTFGIPDVRERNLRAYKTNAEGSFYGYAGVIGNKIGDWVNNHEHTHTTAAHQHTIASQAGHSHTIPGQSTGVDATAASGTAVNLVTRGSFNGHNHGGSTGANASHDHGALTGSTGSSTNGTTWTNATANFWGPAYFRRDSPSYVTNCFVRVKLGW